jgi:hypothetical protein
LVYETPSGHQQEIKINSSWRRNRCQHIQRYQFKAITFLKKNSNKVVSCKDNILVSSIYASDGDTYMLKKPPDHEITAYSELNRSFRTPVVHWLAINIEGSTIQVSLQQLLIATFGA